MKVRDGQGPPLTPNPSTDLGVGHPGSKLLDQDGHTRVGGGDQEGRVAGNEGGPVGGRLTSGSFPSGGRNVYHGGIICLNLSTLLFSQNF